jgi:hypothetical protein
MQHSRRSELVGDRGHWARGRETGSRLRHVPGWHPGLQAMAEPMPASGGPLAGRRNSQSLSPQRLPKNGHVGAQRLCAPVQHRLLHGRDRWAVPQMRNDLCTHPSLAGPNEKTAPRRGAVFVSNPRRRATSGSARMPCSLRPCGACLPSSSPRCLHPSTPR